MIDELEPFKAADMNEVVRLRRIEKAAQEYCNWIMGKTLPQNTLRSGLLENLRKALQGD